MTDTLSHDPTQPSVSQKEPPPPKKLCNDLGLCGVKGNTLSKTSPKTKETKCPGKLQVIPSKTGAVPIVSRVHLIWLGEVLHTKVVFPLFRPVWNIGGLTVCCCSCMKDYSSQLIMNRGKEDVSALSKLVFILFAEAISSGEEIPAALLVHLPHIWLLESEKHIDWH